MLYVGYFEESLIFVLKFYASIVVVGLESNYLTIDMKMYVVLEFDSINNFRDAVENHYPVK